MSSAANQLDSSFKPIGKPAAAAIEYAAGGVGESGDNKRLDQFVGHTLEK